MQKRINGPKRSHVWPIRVLEEDNDREYLNNIPRQKAPMELNTPKPFLPFYPHSQRTCKPPSLPSTLKKQKATPEKQCPCQPYYRFGLGRFYN